MTFSVYIEDITCPRVDMNFIFECSTRYLMSERKRRDLLCNHNGDEDNIHVRVKIRSFRAKAHLVFHWCLYSKMCLQDYLITS